MFRSAHSSSKSSSTREFSGARPIFSNSTVVPGLLQPLDQKQTAHAHTMPNPPRHRSLLAPTRDYIQRRRLRRRLTNIICIPLLSVLAAYAITRQSGGEGFTLPKHARQTLVGTAANHQKAVLVSETSAIGEPNSGVAANPAPISSATNAEGVLGVSMLGGGYMLDDGPHAVTEVRDVVLHDAKRNKDLHVRVFYPNDPGPYPVIVFSHDAGDSPNCCDALTRHWATYGYVTLQPSHDDAKPKTGRRSDDTADWVKATRDAMENPTLWEYRPRDVSFVLDSLPLLQTRVPALAGRMDAEQIGVGGHSLGAFTADAIAGALVDLPGHPSVNFSDPRVKAVLLLSPQGPGEFGLTSHSWDHIKLPLLSMTGSLDAGVDKQRPEWREIPFERSAPGDKYQLFVQGASHLSFVGSRALSSARVAHGGAFLGYTNSASLAFWDAYLKADPMAKLYLQSDALADFSHGVVKISRR